MGNPFAQGFHDGVTLGNHKGYESFGIDVMDPDWDRNLPICVGFAQKPKRKDGSFDGTDATVAKLFDQVLEERTGFNLNAILACMKSDRAATRVAGKVDLEDEACLMHDADKLGRSAVGKLLRRDMSKPVGENRHRPYANPFPEGVNLMNKARSMGSHYSTGTRHSALMVLRKKMGLESSSPETQIKVSKNATVDVFRVKNLMVVIVVAHLHWTFGHRCQRTIPGLQLNMLCSFSRLV